MLSGYGVPSVYTITNIVNGKVYVGSSIAGLRRLTQHRRALRLNEHFNRYLQASWNKHGAEAFEFRIVEECTAENRLGREQHWIDKLQSSDTTKGYNISHSIATLAPSELRSKISKNIWANRTAEERLEDSRKRKVLWEDPEWRADREKDLIRKNGIVHAKRKADPEFEAKCMAGLAATRADLDAMEKRANKIRETWATEKVRAKQSERKKALAKDPTYAARHLERIRSDEVRAKLREHNLKQWEDPEMKRKRLEGLRKGAAAFWADPVKKAERLALLSRKRTEARLRREAERAKGNDIV